MARRSRSGAKALALACAVLLLAELACVGSDLLGSDVSVRERVEGDWVRVYFTNPAAVGSEGQREGGLDQDLALLIQQAEVRVDVAAYDLTLEILADALIAAESRDVDVRVVTETDNAGSDALTTLRDAGVSVFEDQSDGGLMHHKFVTVDDQYIWTGSWNLTWNGTYRNNNNAILIASSALAENYTAEFNEMVAGQFGASSPANTPYPRVSVIVEPDDGSRRSVDVENYFSPEDGVADQIVAEIEGARERVRFMAFVFTSEEIANALVARAEAGVVVQGVMESRNVDGQFDQYERLRRAAHDVLLDGNPYIMHHKVIIVDDETTILGSYNFSHSAETANDENVLIVHDPTVARLFVDEFARVYEQARDAE